MITATDPTRQALRNAEIGSRQERAARNKKLIMAAAWVDCHPRQSIDPGVPIRDRGPAGLVA